MKHLLSGLALVAALGLASAAHADGNSSMVKFQGPLQVTRGADLGVADTVIYNNTIYDPDVDVFGVQIPSEIASAVLFNASAQITAFSFLYGVEAGSAPTEDITVTFYGGINSADLSPDTTNIVFQRTFTGLPGYDPSVGGPEQDYQIDVTLDAADYFTYTPVDFTGLNVTGQWVGIVLNGGGTVEQHGSWYSAHGEPALNAFYMKDANPPGFYHWNDTSGRLSNSFWLKLIAP